MDEIPPLSPHKDSPLGTIIFVILLVLFIAFAPMVFGFTTPWM